MEIRAKPFCEQMELEMASAESIPEYVDISTPVYSDIGLRQTRIVRCSFEVRIPQMEFLLKPLPDELEIAVQDSQFAIHEKLASELKVPVFHGVP